MLYSVDPFGPRRDDLRSAWNTARQIIASSPAEVSPEDAQAILDELRTFLVCHQSSEESIYDAQALERMKNGDAG